jgi:hypothetical protein
MKKTYLLAAAAVTVLGAGFWFMTKTAQTPTTATTTTEATTTDNEFGANQNDLQAKLDIPKLEAVIQITTHKDNVRVAAMKSLSETKNTVAFEEAMKWAQGKNTALRRGALVALTHYADDQIIPFFDKKISGLSENEQILFLNAFVKNTTSGRTQWLQSLSAKAAATDAKPTDTFTGIAATVFSDTTTEATTFAIEKLPPPTQMRLLTALMSREKKTPVFTQYLVRTVENGASVQLQSSAIRYLARIKSIENAPRLERWVKHRAPEVRAAVLESLPELCPTNRWQIINMVAKFERNDFVLRRLLDTLSFLQGQQADEAVNTVQARSASLSGPIQKRIASAKKDFVATKRGDSCAK